MAFSSRCTERWYSAIATTGPTSAADRNGERSQSTASMRLREVMTEKGIRVEEVA